METVTYNQVVRFKSIIKKKNGIFVHFTIKGIRNGTTFSACIAVDMDAVDVSPESSLEEIIEQCARIGIEEFKKSEVRFEGLSCV